MINSVIHYVRNSANSDIIDYGSRLLVPTNGKNFPLFMYSGFKDDSVYGIKQNFITGNFSYVVNKVYARVFGVFTRQLVYRMSLGKEETNLEFFVGNTFIAVYNGEYFKILICIVEKETTYNRDDTISKLSTNPLGKFELLIDFSMEFSEIVYIQNVYKKFCKTYIPIFRDNGFDISFKQDVNEYLFPYMRREEFSSFEQEIEYARNLSNYLINEEQQDSGTSVGEGSNVSYETILP